MTTSIGIAALPECGVDSVVDLVAAADRALYAAKHRGRDRVVLWDPSLADQPTRA